MATYNGYPQNGFYADSLEALELIAHELIDDDEVAFDCMAQRNGWKICPAIVTLKTSELEKQLAEKKEGAE